MNAKDESDRERQAFAQFAQACRRERDRVAAADLAEHDRRFEAGGEECRRAEHLARRLLAAVAR